MERQTKREKDFGPFPPDCSKIKFPHLGEKYRCTNCGNNYHTADKNWHLIPGYGEVCTSCSRGEVKLPEPITITIETITYDE